MTSYPHKPFVSTAQMLMSANAQKKKEARQALI
jgi:hypothetical protein